MDSSKSSASFIPKGLPFNLLLSAFAVLLISDLLIDRMYGLVQVMNFDDLRFCSSRGSKGTNPEELPWLEYREDLSTGTA